MKYFKYSILWLIAVSFICNSCKKEEFKLNDEIQYVVTKQLSRRSNLPSTVTLGNKVLFFGGYPNTRGDSISDVVDIFDTNTNILEHHKLSEARINPTTLIADNKIFLVSGIKQNEFPSTMVDIYDIENNSWTVTQFNKARYSTSTIIAGDKLIVAGGIESPRQEQTAKVSAVVEIYDIKKNFWVVNELSKPRFNITTTVLNNLVFFFCGQTNIPYSLPSINNYSNAIDIYNIINKSWSKSTLSLPDETYYWSDKSLSCVTIGKKILFYLKEKPYEIKPVNFIIVYNSLDDSSYIKYLNSVNIFLAGYNSYKILFCGAANGVITNYDINSNYWSSAQINYPTNYVQLINTSKKLYIVESDWKDLSTSTFYVSNIEIFDYELNNWSRIQAPSVLKYFYTFIVSDNILFFYTIEHENKSITRHINIFKPSLGAWITRKLDSGRQINYAISYKNTLFLYNIEYCTMEVFRVNM